MHGGALVLLAVAMGLHSVVRSIVVDHARSVDASHIEFVDKVETLWFADTLSVLVLAILTILATLFTLLATLPTPALLTRIQRASVDDGGFRVASGTAVLTAFGAAQMGRARRTGRASWSRAAAGSVTHALSAPLLFGAGWTVACTGIGAASGRSRSWWRGSLLVAIVNGEVGLGKGRIVSKLRHKAPEAVHV
jgi:hypothetical protein